MAASFTLQTIDDEQIRPPQEDGKATETGQRPAQGGQKDFADGSQLGSLLLLSMSVCSKLLCLLSCHVRWVPRGSLSLLQNILFLDYGASGGRSSSLHFDFWSWPDGECSRRAEASPHLLPALSICFLILFGRSETPTQSHVVVSCVNGTSLTSTRFSGDLRVNRDKNAAREVHTSPELTVAHLF